MNFAPKHILFSPTTKCNLNCGHCSIKQSSLCLSSKTAINFLKKAKTYGIEQIGFTGGEPFLAMNFLIPVIKAAYKQNMFFDKIVTNGVWFNSDKQLTQALTKLQTAGYDGQFCLSVDAFHNQSLNKLTLFINKTLSIYNQYNVMSLAVVFGAKEEVTQEKLLNLAAKLKADYICEENISYIENNQARIDIIPIQLTASDKAGKLTNSWQDKNWFSEDYCRGPGNTFFIMPDGTAKPCCGYANHCHQLTIGNINKHTPAQLVKNANKNKFVKAVFTKGLSEIRKCLQKQGVKFPGKTSNHCLFCGFLLQKIPQKQLNQCL